MKIKKIFSIAFITFIAISCSETEFSSFGSGSLMQESFQQTRKVSDLDILIVVDNSTSMVEEQKKLAKRMKHFTSQLDEVNWQLAVTTTDTSNGPYGLKGRLLPVPRENSYVLSKHSPQLERKFTGTIVREETGKMFGGPSDDETPIKAALFSIQKSERETRQFFREKANLSILIITDEDENQFRGIEPDDLIQEFQQRWPNKLLSVFAVAIRPGDSKCHRDNNGSYAFKIQELVEKTFGLMTSICSSDYASQLTEIGRTSYRLSKSFTLKFEPAPDTLVVDTIPHIENLEYEVFGKKLIFTKSLPHKTQIFVTYAIK